MKQKYTLKEVYTIINQYSNNSLDIVAKELNVQENIPFNREKLVLLISRIYLNVILSSIKPNVHCSDCSKGGFEQ